MAKDKESKDKAAPAATRPQDNCRHGGPTPEPHVPTLLSMFLMKTVYDYLNKKGLKNEDIEGEDEVKQDEMHMEITKMPEIYEDFVSDHPKIVCENAHKVLFASAVDALLDGNQGHAAHMVHCGILIRACLKHGLSKLVKQRRDARAADGGPGEAAAAELAQELKVLEKAADMSAFLKTMVTCKCLAGGGTDLERCENCCAQRRCGGKKLLQCKGCRQVRYCSATCQKQHWSTHKRACKEGGK